MVVLLEEDNALLLEVPTFVDGGGVVIEGRAVAGRDGGLEWLLLFPVVAGSMEEAVRNS